MIRTAMSQRIPGFAHFFCSWAWPALPGRVARAVSQLSGAWIAASRSAIADCALTSESSLERRLADNSSCTPSSSSLEISPSRAPFTGGGIELFQLGQHAQSGPGSAGSGSAGGDRRFDLPDHFGLQHLETGGRPAVGPLGVGLGDRAAVAVEDRQQQVQPQRPFDVGLVELIASAPC